MEPVSLPERLREFGEHWAPRTIGRLNGHDIMVLKAQGKFLWQIQKDGDELFVILKGNLIIELRDQEIALEEGDLFVVPKGTEYRPVAYQEVQMMRIGPPGTLNTGHAAVSIADRVAMVPNGHAHE